MKQVFFIPPIKHMEFSELGTNNLFVLGQYYVTNLEYKKYVLKAKKDGRFLILDNGVDDHGVVLENKDIFEIAKELRPNEVIPTDNLFDCDSTIKNTEQMIRLLRTNNIEDVNVFMCPQGNDFDNWLECYKYALSNEDVKTIGMSKKTLPKIIYGVCNDTNIASARNKVFDYLLKNNLIKKDLHFLGSEGPDEYRHYKGCEYVRSTDSCVAILQGINNIKFSDRDYRRLETPSNYFDLDIENKETVLYNINYFKKEVLC